MTKHARLSPAGDVIDICVGDPELRFPPHLAAEFVIVPDHITRGWKQVGGAWMERPKPEGVDVLPEQSSATPRTLAQIEFVLLVQEVAGIDEAGFVELYKNPALEGLWIKFDMATRGVNRDHPLVENGLDALIAVGAITETQKAAVFENWPLEGDPE